MNKSINESQQSISKRKIKNLFNKTTKNKISLLETTDAKSIDFNLSENTINNKTPFNKLHNQKNKKTFLPVNLHSNIEIN